ncbi:carbon catabolite repressor protein 4 homolog 1-like isoform X1 [Magnolia sinica]|uniref:carbon catabolite repressor protein 4 homolog 1-like isoform X1 n=1 Tax=Magnolia sinica TaxID=86752 RepID=UPI00265B1A9F|nr:carbon catabolite repressor protein 4 homolog 1-like isoform X1 [Magnolia sinica]
MKGSVEDSWILIVKFPYSTPVVGVEFIPYFRVTKPNIEAPEYTLKYNWYRLESNESNESNEEFLACSVHPTSLAKFQCWPCAMLKIRVEDSCHCSERCFRDSWPHHRARHNDAWGRLGGCGSWSSDDIYPYFLEKTATVVERDDKSWLEVGCSETYVPAAIDVGYILKLECAVVDSVTGNPLAPTNITLTDRVIFPPLPHLRRMIQIGSETQPVRSRTFNVLTYNVLSDHYARLGATRYHYCPKWALTWQYRRQNLLREIIRYDADIICLQEVQSDHFEDFFAPELGRHGYSAIYQKKINPIEFLKTAELRVNALPSNQRKDGARRLMKDNVAVIVVLESTEGGPVPNMLQSGSSQLICKYSHTIQCRIHRCQTNAGCGPFAQCGEYSSQCSYVLLPCSYPCTDLWGSELLSWKVTFLPPLIKLLAVHELVASKSVHPNHPERKDDPFGLFQQTKLSHNMSLVSAYTSFLRTSRNEPDVRRQQTLMDSNTNEPLFTNFSEQFVGTLDYIFYTEDTLVVDGLLELLDEALLREDTALPSPRWSSDHIALMGSFRIRPKTHGALASSSSSSFFPPYV